MMKVNLNNQFFNIFNEVSNNYPYKIKKGHFLNIANLFIFKSKN